MIPSQLSSTVLYQNQSSNVAWCFESKAMNQTWTLVFELYLFGFVVTGRAFQRTQILSTPPSVVGSYSAPALRSRRPRTVRFLVRSCCCSVRTQSLWRPAPHPPAAGTPRPLLCPPLLPPLLLGPRPPRLPRPWSTTLLHTAPHLTSRASCPSPRAPRPLRRGRASTTASWRSPTASASCPPACCPLWAATRLSPLWTQRAAVWAGITSCPAPPPRTPATMGRKSSDPPKSKVYSKRKNNTWKRSELLF